MILNWFQGFFKSATFWENTPLSPGERGGVVLAERSAKSTIFLGTSPLSSCEIYTCILDSNLKIDINL